MGALFANNAVDYLWLGRSATDTILYLVGQGKVFPQPKSSSDWVALTIRNKDAFEIVKCTGFFGGAAQVLRGQEGTTPQAFPAGSRVENCFTAAAWDEMQAAIASLQIAAAARANPIGAIFFIVGDRAPSGSMKAQGQTIKRAEYPALTAFLEAQPEIYAVDAADKAANPGKFGRGDGSTTIQLPDIQGDFIRVADWTQQYGTRKKQQNSIYQTQRVATSTTGPSAYVVGADQELLPRSTAYTACVQVS